MESGPFAKSTLSGLLAASMMAASCGPAGGSAAGPSAVPAAESYTAEIANWREQRENRLKADGGWLTVAGLFWLKEGPNRFGTDPEADIELPAGTAPPRAGVFEFSAGTTTVTIEPGAAATVGGRTLEPQVAVALKADSSGSPDVVTMGSLQMHVIQRGERYAIRLKDMQSSVRKQFRGLRWYPVDPAYRVTARFVPHDEPVEIAVPTILGTIERMPSPGYALFTLGGVQMRLDPVLEDPEADQLFFIFRDATSGPETYPAGRFLYTDLPKDGAVTLDFNKAYNPPCAFTRYATCPLPPEQNRLAARIQAGELNYVAH